MGGASSAYSAVQTVDPAQLGSVNNGARVKQALTTPVAKLWGGTVLNLVSLFLLAVSFLFGELESIEYFTMGPIWLMYMNSFFTALIFLMLFVASRHLNSGGPPINGFPTLKVYNIKHIQRTWLTQLVFAMFYVYLTLKMYAFYVNFNDFIDDFDDYVTEAASIPDVMMHARFGDIQIFTAASMILSVGVVLQNVMEDARPRLSDAMQLIRHRQIVDRTGTTMPDAELEKRLLSLEAHASMM